MRAIVAALVLFGAVHPVVARSLREQAEETARRIAEREPVDQVEPGPSALTHAERITEGLAMLVMACDMGGTMRAALQHWGPTAAVPTGRVESGVPALALMGATPSPSTVVAYFAGAAAATLVVGRILPQRYRPYFYGAVALLEGDVVAYNLGTSGVCGLGGRPVMSRR